MTKQSHISRYLYTYMVYFTSQTKKKSYFTYIDCDFQIQARDTEKQIKEEYERIYQFLRDEERSRLIALRKEEEENTRRVMEMMDNISKHISTLSGKIESTERRLMRDDITFLKTYKDTKERLDFKLQDPELLSGVPIDANKHLEPLKLRVKKIMEHILSLPDLTTALNTGDEQQPSDNTETPGHLGFVLASEGFTSGKHSWEVEVGDSPSWAVGVLEEPINKERKITFRPDSGFWALMLKNGEYQAGYTRLEVKKKPEKIGVELDYDNRQVSFFNSTDKSCIISLENKCSEKLFPFVCPWITGTEQNHEGLQISILKVKFLTEKISSFFSIPGPKSPSINTTSKPAPVKIHVAVSGSTLNSHEIFKRKLDMSLEECSQENCRIILVFCPIVTQMGRDMETALKNVSGDKPIILVLMHHSYNPDHIDDIPIRASRSNVVKVVQCVFHETVGLLECELNQRAVRAARAELQQFQTKTVVVGQTGGTLAPPPSQTHP
uniref:B30.2/SPRY domain-containing protein n=1 Tax=Scleropages formosus TaxID=113540 RepID=A0A8C9WF25_SCLFO